MDTCPNCGAELAPSVLSCGHCRMPLTPGAAGASSGVGAPRGHGYGDQVGRQPDGYLPSRDASWPSAPAARPVPLHTGAGHGPPPGPGEDPRQRRQRRNTITLVVLASVVLAIALVSGLVVVFSLSGAPAADESAVPQAPSQAPTQPPPASASSGAPPSQSAPSQSAPSQSAPTPTPTPTSTPTPQQGPTTTAADAQTCAPGLQVPAKGTSCEFARAVRAKVAEVGGDEVEFSVRAHSPVTKKDYTMECVRNDVLTTCTGGNNAVVWIHNGG